MTAKLWSFSETLGGDAAEWRGMSVLAVDGSVGTVKEVVDQIGRAHLIVDTGPWIFGKTIIVPAGLVTAVDPNEGSVFIDRDKDEVMNAPEHDPEAAEDITQREALTAYYGAERDAEPDAGAGSGPTPAVDESPAAATFGRPGESATPPAPFGGAGDGDAPATPAPGGSDWTDTPAPPAPGASDWTDTPAPPASRGASDAGEDRLGGSRPSDAGGAPTTPGVESDAAAGRPSAAIPSERPEESSEQAEQREIEITPAARATPTAGAGADEQVGGTEDAPPKRRFAREGGPSTSKSATPSRSGGKSKSSDEVPIARYDSLTAAEVVARLRNLSQRELAQVERYEKRHEGRQTVLGRIESLREAEPWRGYDDATVAEIRKKLADADEDRAKAVRDYERRHRDRKGVMEAARRTVASA